MTTAPQFEETELTRPIAELLVRKLTDDHVNHVYLKRRLDALVWIALAMFCVLVMGAVLRYVNYKTLRVDVSRRDAQISELTAHNADSDKRLIKLRSEIALRNARTRALRMVFQSGRDVRVFDDVVRVADGYAFEINRAIDEGRTLTTAEIEREACLRLAGSGYKCAP